MSTERTQQLIDTAAWDVFARHQPYYHILSSPSMLDPGSEQQVEFWKSGEEEIELIRAFGDLSRVEDVGVDFGCGLGRLTRALRTLTTKQVGIDISTEMLRQARALNGALATIEFRQIAGQKWPIDSNSSALVVSLHVLQHLSSFELMESSIQEIGRVLKQGGRTVFQVPTMTWRGQTVGLAKRLMPGVWLSNEDKGMTVLKRRLEAFAKGEACGFTEREVMHDMFRLDCRRMKSIPLRRLHAALQRAGLSPYRMERRNRGVYTLVAAEKI